jgi:hypothetical protein
MIDLAASPLRAGGGHTQRIEREGGNELLPSQLHAPLTRSLDFSRTIGNGNALSPKAYSDF